MLCSDTNTALPAVKIGLPLDLAKDISYLMEAIRSLGGNGKITLFVSGGNVIDQEISVKPKRKRPA